MVPLIFQSSWNNTVSTHLHLHHSLDLDSLDIFSICFKHWRWTQFCRYFGIWAAGLFKSRTVVFGVLIRGVFVSNAWNGTAFMCAHQSRTTNLPYQSPWCCQFISQGRALRSHGACSPSLGTGAGTCPKLRLLTFTFVTNSNQSLSLHFRDLLFAIYFHGQDSIIPYFLRLRNVSVDVIVVITFAGSSRDSLSHSVQIIVSL